jgi:hypothetical protein
MNRLKTAVIGAALLLVIILNSGCVLFLLKGRGKDSPSQSSGASAQVEEEEEEEEKREQR